MRRLLIIWILSTSVIVTAQQEAQYSLYQTNNFLINPAVAGSYDYWNVKGGFRAQWVGMEGSPTTMFASFHGRVSNPKLFKGKRKTFSRSKGSGMYHGFGAKFYSDEAGAITYTGFSGSYAVHMALNRWYTLSFGASFGLKRFQLDGSKLKFVQTPDDPSVQNQVYSDDMPDLNLGFW
jgi:type IX secretion system PorP/SprF family membrane protein